MCHQSVGLIARHLEAHGYPTIGFTSARTITESANPPRSVFVDFPLGHTTGPPNEPAVQRQILSDGLRRGLALTEPGFVDLALRWDDDDWKADPLSWSRRQQDAGQSGKPAGDTRNDRSDQPKYQSQGDADAAAAVDWDDQCRVCVGLPES